jgi:hypothetical protein
VDTLVNGFREPQTENDMQNIGKELETLKRQTTKELKARYAELFGEPASTWNRDWLLKRIAWRLQALAEGGLSERARRRASELANDADLRVNPPKVKLAPTETNGQTVTAVLHDKADHRLPLPGTVITREYKSQTLQVKVLVNGFEYAGEVYKSLSAVAKAVTGQHCNGYHFFRMTKEAV